MDNLLSWNLIFHIVLFISRLPLCRNGFEPGTCQRKSPLKWYVCQPSQILYLDKLWINCDGIRFQEIRLFIISNYWNMIPNIVLLISRYLDTIPKCFCTLDEANDLTLQMRYVPAIYHLCSWGYYSNNLEDIFLGHPVVEITIVR